MKTKSGSWPELPALEGWWGEQVAAGASPSATLVQVFCGEGALVGVQNTLTDAARAFPGAVVVGVSTGIGIQAGHVKKNQTIVAVTVFQRTRLVPFQGRVGSTSAEALGRDLGRAVNQAGLRALFVFSGFQGQKAADLLGGLDQSLPPEVAVAGGCAGWMGDGAVGVVGLGDRVEAASVVAVALVGESLVFHQHFHLCWNPLGRALTITRTQGVRVFEIDGRPVVEVYRRYLGTDLPDNRDLMMAFPLIVNRSGVEIVQSPEHVHPDGSVDLHIGLKEGETVRFGFGQVEWIVDSVDTLIEAMGGEPVESIFVYSCLMRHAFLQGWAEIETRPLEALGPTNGFFTNGEFYRQGGTSHLMTATMTTLVLSEDPTQSAARNREACLAELDALKRSVGRPGGLGNLPIVKGLSHLVEVTTSELAEHLHEVSRLHAQVVFEAEHDALTGLPNRRKFDLEAERLDGTDGALGVVVCDIDGLKLVNDTLGHDQGDGLILGVARALAQALDHRGTAFRTGGDEFVVFLEGRSADDVAAFQRSLVLGLEASRDDEPLPRACSVGTAHTDSRLGRVPALVQDADSSMYSHKSRSRRRNLEVYAEGLIALGEAWGLRTADEQNLAQDLAGALALRWGLGEAVRNRIALLVRYRDIGEVSASRDLLLKAGPLTAKERERLRRHPEVGDTLAQRLPRLQGLEGLILKHHEWWDGEGYPLGVAGDEIPVECRVAGPAIAYAAMVSPRPYRGPLSEDVARAVLRDAAGTQFDPRLVGELLKILAKRRGPTGHPAER